MDVKYEFFVTDTLNDKVNAGELVKEIGASPITIAVSYISTSNNDLHIWMKAALSEGEVATLISLINSHTGELIAKAESVEISNFPKADTSDNIRVSVYKPEGLSSSVVTHNFADPCTWYGDSVKVDSEVLTDSGDGLTFLSINYHWIDLFHGRMTNEDKVSSKYQIVVKVNDVVQTDRHLVYATATYNGVTYTAKRRGLTGETITLAFDGVKSIQSVVKAWNLANPYNPVAHNGAGSTVPPAGTPAFSVGSYTVNPVTGTVTFATSQSGNAVTASYWRENGSTYYMIPPAGKAIEILRSEVQFSLPTVLNTPINFEVWIYHPDQVTYPGVKILYAKEVYKSLGDMISTGNEGQGRIEATDNLSNPVTVLPFDYATIKVLSSAVGAELRVTKGDGIPATSELGTGTFYIITKSI